MDISWYLGVGVTKLDGDVSLKLILESNSLNGLLDIRSEVAMIIPGHQRWP